MFSGEKYLTRRTIWQCCHGGRIIFMPNPAAAEAYKAAAMVQAALCPNPTTAGPARAAYAALGASAMSAAAGSLSPLPAQMDRGNVVTKEDLIQRAVVVNCPAPKPCVKVVAVHPPALSKCMKVHHKMTQAAETPVLEIIRTLALAGSLCDGAPPPGFVSWIVENQYVADELPVAVPAGPLVAAAPAAPAAPPGVLDPVQNFRPIYKAARLPDERGEDCPRPACAIQSLEVTCDHGRAPKEQRLQVVAGRHGAKALSPGDRREDNYHFGVLGGKLEIKKQWGRKDDIHVVCKVGHGGMEEVRFDGGAWKAGAKHTFPFEDTRADDDELWLANAKPITKIVKGRSRCHGSSIDTKVEIFPSPKYNYLLAIEWEYLSALLNGDFINFYWGKIKKRATDVWQGNKPADKWKQEGTISATWGWEEDSDWRVYYDARLSLGGRLKLKKDIPFPLLCLIFPQWGLLAKFVGDVYFLLSYEITISLTGSPGAKFYSTGESKYYGEGELKLQGHVRFGVAAKLGTDRIWSKEVSGTVKAQLDSPNKITVQRSGVKAKLELKYPEMSLNLRITTKWFYVETKRQDYVWVIHTSQASWKQEFQLLPPKRKSGS